MAAFDSISEIFDEIIRNSKIKGGNILRITILFLLLGFKPVQHSGVSQKRNGTLMNK